MHNRNCFFSDFVVISSVILSGRCFFSVSMCIFIRFRLKKSSFFNVRFVININVFLIILNANKFVFRCIFKWTVDLICFKCKCSELFEFLDFSVEMFLKLASTAQICQLLSLI